MFEKYQKRLRGHALCYMQVLNVNEVEEDLRGLNMDLRGAAEWTAVSLQLPKEHTQGQLACILLCKGVLKSQVCIVTVC